MTKIKPCIYCGGDVSEARVTTVCNTCLEKFNNLNLYCLDFMNEADASPGKTATEEEKTRFISSIKKCHAQGFYLVYSKKAGSWKLVDTKPETLGKQKNDLPTLIKTLFQAQ